MTNPIKGEYQFSTEQGQTYTLRYSANAWVELEDKLNEGIVAIGQRLSSWATDPSAIRLGTLRAVLWAGLRDHHPDVQLKDAGDLIVGIGGVLPALNVIAEAFARSFPETLSRERAAAQEESESNPTARGQPTNGTGRAS